MKYFSHTLLGQYFVQKIPLSVFVNSEYLRIVDIEDISDPNIGSGMRISGEMEPFDYRTISHIKVGDNIIDIATATKPTEEEPKDTDKGKATDDAKDQETVNAKDDKKKTAPSTAPKPKPFGDDDPKA